jgi:hypothetical protein
LGRRRSARVLGSRSCCPLRLSCSSGFTGQSRPQLRQCQHSSTTPPLMIVSRTTVPVAAHDGQCAGTKNLNMARARECSHGCCSRARLLSARHWTAALFYGVDDCAEVGRLPDARRPDLRRHLLWLVMRGETKDWHRCQLRVGELPPSEFRAAHYRHVHVQQHQARPLLPHLLERLGAVPRAPRVVAPRGE